MPDTATTLYTGVGVAVALIAGYFFVNYLGKSGKDIYPNVNSTPEPTYSPDASSVPDWKGGRKTKKSKSKNRKTRRKH